VAQGGGEGGFAWHECRREILKKQAGWPGNKKGALFKTRPCSFVLFGFD